MDVDANLLTVGNVKIVRTKQNKKWPTLLKELGALKESLSFKTLKFDLKEEALKVKAQSAYCIAVAVATQKDYLADYSIADELLKLTFEQDNLDNYPLNVHNIIIKKWIKNKTGIEANVQPMHFPIMLTRPLINGCDGLVATLTVWNTGVACEKNDNCWVPAPASYLLDYDDDFYEGLKRAQAYVQTLLTTNQSMPILVWDIEPTLDGSLKKITGLSASTTMAVAALSALRPLFERSQPELYRDLGQINTQRAAISAEFHSDGNLTLVDFLPAKLKGIKIYNSQQSVFNPLRTLYIASNQPEATTTDTNQLKLSSNPDINTLIKTLATDTNTSAIFGEWPNINEVFSDNTYHDFIGREWLINHINSTLADINNTGIICLVAPAGWGKTAFALHLAKQRNTNHPSLYVDGYGFVRREGKNTISRFGDLTNQATTVIRQLNNCTRYHLNLKKEIRSNAEAETILSTLLNDCSEQAQHDQRQKPIILLLDAADELSGTTITNLLPKEWPKGVVLIVTSRASGLTNITQQIDKSIALRTIDVTSINDSNKKDIEKYIQFRRDELKNTIEINDTVVNAIINACKDPDSEQYFFLVAHGLLAERDSLSDDIKVWREKPNSLPKGIKDYINSQIMRSLEKTTNLLRKKTLIEDDEVAKNMASFVLFLLAMSEAAWPVNDLKTQLLNLKKYCKENTDINLLEPFNLVEENLFSLKNLRRYDVFWQGYQDLFDKGHVLNYQTRFIHTLYRESILEMLEPKQRNMLHKLWGLLCEEIWQDDNAHSPDDDNLLHYALRYGPSHLANGDESLLAAQRLLDFRPYPKQGYLDVMYEQLKEEALSIIMMHIRQITLHNVLKSTENQYWLTALDSLRFVLSNHDTYLRTGQIALLPTLYNAMAGYFDGQTELGKKLLAAISTYPKPWLKNLEPDAADAFGAIIHNLGSDINCMAHTEDGEWLGVGLKNGVVLVINQEELKSGTLGLLAYKHEYTVEGIVLISSQNDGFVVAHYQFSEVYIQTQKRIERKEEPWKIQHQRSVNCIALLAHKDEGFVVASGGDGGRAYIQTQKRLEQEEEPWKIQHQRSVNCVALLGHKDEGFVVASAGETDGMTYIQTQKRLEQEEEPWKIQHQRSVNCIALLGHKDEGFVVVSSGNDGMTYIQTQKRLEQEEEPWKIQHQRSVNCIALLEQEDEAFVVVSSGNDGMTYIQTQKRLEQEDEPWGVLHQKSINCIALLGHKDEGFVVALSGNDGMTYIQTQKRLEQEDEPWGVLHQKSVNYVALLAYKDEGFVVVSSGNDGMTYIQTQKRLEQENEPWGILHQKGVNCIALLAHKDEGFVVASGGADGRVYIQTQESLESVPFKNKIPIIQCNNFGNRVVLLAHKDEGFVVSLDDKHGRTYIQTQKRLKRKETPLRIASWGVIKNIALVVHKDEGFVVASGGAYGMTYIQTQKRLERKEEPWKIEHKNGVNDIALLAHKDEGFVVAAVAYSQIIYIQTQKRLEQGNDPLEIKVRQGVVENLALLVTQEEGFVVASGGDGGRAYIQTQKRFERKEELWEVKHQGYVSSVALLAHKDEGFVVASGGTDGMTYIQTQTNLIQNAKPRGIKHQGDVSSVALLAHKDEGFVVASGGADGFTCIRHISDTFDQSWFANHEVCIKKYSIIDLEDSKLLVSINTANVLRFIAILDPTQNEPFFKNLLVHFNPNYEAHDHYFCEGHLRIYIANRTHNGIAVSEYEVMNFPT